jgi:adenylate cyclase
MIKPRRRAARLVSLTGGLCLLASAALVFADPGQTLSGLRESIFDRLLVFSPRSEAVPSVIIVDIDRQSLATFGPWPWPRDKLASLVDKIADAKPQALAINILLPAHEGTPEHENASLALALARIPSVLAVVLDPNPGGTASVPTSVAVAETVEAPDLMVAPGAVLPAPGLAASAQGFGVISLPASEGEPVRAVALIAGAGNTLFAGFAAETLRVASGGGTIIATAPPQVLRIGTYFVPLAENGLMRLHFATASDRRSRIVSASSLLSGAKPLSLLTGKIVFLGASAPEAGGLRLTAVDPFMPSVEIEAEAAQQMLIGHVPWRTGVMAWVEGTTGLVLGVLSILAIVWLSPGGATAAVLGMSLAWIVLAISASTQMLWLTDPVSPLIVGLVAAQGTGLAQLAITHRQRQEIERRFALHLPPEVVRRIVDNPGQLRLAGESRIVTALFTDIEGFTALSQRISPETLISLLDRYVDIVAGIIVDHGGMVDKIVGDAVHGFFNAPVDLPQHAEKAVACACRIRDATETLRRDPAVAAAALGRTRIGIETGQAVLGEVGRGAKRDYTAYGHAVNLASRLEGANKEFGSSIAIGPGTAAALAGQMQLRRLGSIAIKGVAQEVEVFTTDCLPQPPLAD